MRRVKDLASLLALVPLGGADDEETFEAPSIFVPDGRIYGGQALAQAAAAAQLTVESDWSIHGLHGLFLRAGDVHEPVTIGVERLRDGRSFAARQVRVRQKGRDIFTAMVSLTTSADGPEHTASPWPNLPGPDDLAARVPYVGSPPDDAAGAEDLMEVREVPPTFFNDAAVSTHAAWIRFREELPESATVRQSALAYVSDAVIQNPILASNDLDWWSPEMSMASLDHAMWWYGLPSSDGWMLTIQESPVAGRGRGVGLGRIYNREGQLLAVVGQEMMIRRLTGASLESGRPANPPT